jgi:hypothetical protein
MREHPDEKSRIFHLDTISAHQGEKSRLIHLDTTSAHLDEKSRFIHLGTISAHMVERKLLDSLRRGLVSSRLEALSQRARRRVG